ncbi:hypothetical protein [Rhizobium giardinii]|uniref:hypothetical protein n=1 Tax=Rhizobium giardinii TaxID=56731 RepID=UPI0039E14C5C
MSLIHGASITDHAITGNVGEKHRLHFTTTGATFLYETDTHRLWFDGDGKGGDKEAILLATFDKCLR